LIQPAGISGGKLPSVHPCPKILALQRAIFEAATHGTGGASMDHENHRESLSGSASQSQSFIDR
jgi:hypothetical protein